MLAILAMLAMAAQSVPPQSPPAHRAQLAAKLQSDLQRLAAAAPGVAGISVVDLSSGQRFGVNEGLVFPQGSAIKIPILIELYRRADAGELKLTDRLPVRRDNQVGGSGLLQYFSDGGSEMSLQYPHRPARHGSRLEDDVRAWRGADKAAAEDDPAGGERQRQ
jgi:beta-lactamase class A